MIDIRKITLREINMPLVEPFQISSGLTTDRRILLIELEDSDGVTSWSECVAGEKPNYSPETIDTASHIIQHYLSPLLLQSNYDSMQALNEDFYQIKGHLMAKGGLEMGCWGLLAEKEGQSLARYIGGTLARLKSGISIGIQATPEALLDKVKGYLAEGYHKIKVKIKPGFDVDYIDCLRTAITEPFELMVDANNIYTWDHIDTLKALDNYDLLMIEQPLAWDDVYQHSKLQPQLKTPLCLDESIKTLADAVQMKELDSGRIINIKPGRVGGFYHSIQIHDYCLQHQIPVWCGGMLESGIGRAYNVALASLENFTLTGDLSNSRRYWAEDIIDPAWQMDGEGFFDVPFDKPGLGVTVNIALIDALTVKKEVLT